MFSGGDAGDALVGGAEVAAAGFEEVHHADDFRADRARRAAGEQGGVDGTVEGHAPDGVGLQPRQVVGPRLDRANQPQMQLTSRRDTTAGPLGRYRPVHRAAAG